MLHPPLIAVIEVPNAICARVPPQPPEDAGQAEVADAVVLYGRRSSKGEAPYVKVGAATAAVARSASSLWQGFAVLVAKVPRALCGRASGVNPLRFLSSY